MATETQTKLVGFCLGNKSNYSATAYANHIWFDPTNKQILLNGIEYIPKKLSELVNDKNFLTSITKSMVENVLTGNITSHTHSYLPLSGGTLTGTLTLPGIKINGTSSVLPSHYFHYLYDGTDVYEHFGLYDRNIVTYGNFRFFDGNGSYKTLRIGGDGTFNWNGTNVSLEGHTHTFASLTSKPTTLSGYGITDAALASDLSKYLPLTGGTLSGSLTCNGDYINMNNDSGSRGYRGFFNQSNNTSRASGSHIFMKGGGQALGTNSVSIGYQAYAGIRNKDSDATTYPYIAWQWMPTEKFSVDTTNSATLSGGEYYGFPLLPNEMVQWNIGGQNVIYENSSSYKELLVVIKASDADTGLVFGGKTTLPYRASKTLIAGKYIVGSGEYLKNITEFTINDVKYYQVIIYTWETTAYPTYYDFTQQVKVMCATKVNNSNYSGASSYASGYYSVASGYSSVASGYYSVASGNSSVASGSYSVASGSYSVASGLYSVASGLYSVASGLYSVASGYSSVASGYYSVASGLYSVASGLYSVASGDFSVVLARNGETMSSYQTIVGKFNAKVAGLFIIGNGTSDTARSNAFVVDDSGNVTAKYFSGYANAIGGEGIKVYAANSDEINFGGTSSSTTIYFGYRSMDSRPTPTIYNFGKGTAILEGLARRLAYTSISENADINTYINEGVYSTTQTSIMRSLVNAPTNRLNGEMRLEVISSSSSTTYIIQKFWSRTAGSGWKLHIRTTSSDGWTVWKEIALTDSSITGNAATATALTSSAGSATQPIYFSNGKPTACSYTLAKSVPSNAVFTDTTYSVATASADGLMSAAMFKAQMVKSVGIKQGAEMMKPDGTITITDHRVYITQDKSNINGVYQQAIGENDVKIPNATKDYDGSMSYTDKRKLDGISPYAPKKVVALRLSFNADATVTVISGGGDYDMTQDAELMGSKYVEQTSTNNLYLTLFSLDLAASSTDTLYNLFNNSFVEFSFMGKSTDGISNFSIPIKSNFDGDTLDIQFGSTKQDDSWVVDCVWEFF